MANLDLTIGFNETTLNFDYFKETDTYLPHYGIRINGIPKPKYEIIVEPYTGHNPNFGKTELIFFIDDKRVEYWDEDFITLDIALEIYKLIIKNENK